MVAMKVVLRSAPRVVAISAAALVAILLLVSSARASGLTAGDVVVLRDGNGGVESITSSAMPVHLDEFGPLGGLAESIALPTVENEGGAGNKPFTDSGSAGSDGMLTLSANGGCLLAVGYKAKTAPPATSKVTETKAKEFPRVVAVVNGKGEVNTTTALTNFANENNARSATSTDCKKLWVGGNGTKTTGGVLATELGKTEGTQLNEPDHNARQVEIVGGQLYMSADPTKNPDKITIGTVGSGLPTAKGTGINNLPFEEGQEPEQPYAFSFLTLGLGSTPDTLYVADKKKEGETGAVVKYSLVSGKWVPRGSVEIPEVSGVTANDVNGLVTIYATSSGLDTKEGTLYRIADASGVGGVLSGVAEEIGKAPVNEAWRGVAFAPGTTIGAGGTPPKLPSISAAETALAGATNDPTNRTMPITVSDPEYEAKQLTVTVASSKEGVAGSTSVTGTGGERTLHVTPGEPGITKLTLTVEAPNGTFSSTQITYGASAYQGSESDRYYSKAADTGATLDVGGGYMIAAGDEGNAVKLYKERQSGPPAKTWDFSSQLPFGAQQANIHGVARSGNVLYFVGGMANSQGGLSEPSHSTMYAATITGSGASTELAYLGSYTGLREDLIEWDTANGNPLGLAASAAPGQLGESPTGFKIQGIDFAPGSSSVAYISFRAPLEPTEGPESRTKALVIPVTNFSSLFGGNPNTTTHATFGTPLEWKLGELSIRQIRANGEGEYLILTSTASSASNVFQVWGWDGETEDEPVLLNESIPLVEEGVWDAITSTPEPIRNGSEAELLQDNSKTVWYGPGTKDAEKGLTVGLQKSLGRLVALQIPKPGIPGAPKLTAGGTPNQGTFTLRWKPAPTLRARFTLQHKNAASEWTTVASGLSKREYTFTPSSREAEGTWKYRVNESNESGESAYSAESEAVKVDRTPPNTPTATADRAPDYAGNGGWFKDSVTVSFTANGDPTLADGSAPSGVDPATLAAPQTFNTSGTHLASGTVADKAGNVSAAGTLTVKVDATPPSLEIECPATALVSEEGVTATVTASDGESGLASDPSGTVPIDTSVVGTKVTSRTAIDNVGHETSKSCTTQVVYPTPGTPKVTAGTNPNGDGKFTLGWSGDDPLQFPGLSYTLQHHNAATATWSTAASDIGALSYAFEGQGEEEGTWVYRVQGSDPGHGQTTPYSPESAAVVVDETPPFPPATSVSRPPDYAGNGGWYKNSVAVSFSHFVDATLADGSPGSGIDPASIPGEQTVSTSGVHNVCATVSDKVGNVSSPGCRTVRVEADPPTLKVECPQTALEGSSVSATVTASDPYSGLASDPSGTVPIDTSHTGEQTITRTAVSNLGFETTKSCTTTVESSTPGAPTVTAGANPSRNGRFTLGWSGPDPLQYFGLRYTLQHHDASTATWSTVANNVGERSYEFAGGGEEEGTWVYRVQASDPSTELTSEYSAQSAPVVVDRTPPLAPTGKATRAPDFSGNGGWYKDSATVTFSDNGDPALADGSPGSGVEPSSLTGEHTYNTSGVHTASGTVADKAGNVSQTAMFTVQVDATAPSLSVSCPSNAVVGQSGVQATVVASDGESGLASDPTGTVPISTAHAGPQTVTRTAIDNVGHETTRSCTTQVHESPPEFGRCERAKGEFNNSKCTTQTAGGKYEWHSGVANPALTTHAGSVKLETADGALLRCSTEHGTATFSTAKTLGGVVLQFTGCELRFSKCTTAGHAAGEIETKQLEGQLGWISKAAGQAGLALRPSGGSGPFAEYSCGGIPYTLTGGVAARVKAGKPMVSQTLKYKGRHGVQGGSGLEGSPEGLTDTQAGETAQSAALDMNMTLAFAEALEVNTHF
jgi:hypothetical protein